MDCYSDEEYTYQQDIIPTAGVVPWPLNKPPNEVPLGHVVYRDNLFTSIRLFNCLLSIEYGTRVLAVCQ
jgi:hypothetical protein